MGEVRYSSLTRTFPDNADALFDQAEKEMKKRYAAYKQMAGKDE
jgi:pyruvate-ferredoxin/flavodoxin oxidoreductase